LDTWLNKIDEEELKYLEPVLFVFEDSPEEAAQFLYREGMSRPMASVGDKEEQMKRSFQELKNRPPKKYWKQVKSEIYSLVCTDSKKYSELRGRLSSAEENGTKALVAIVSGSIGSILGIEAGIISGFVTLALHAVIRVGTEAYCAIATENS